MKRPAGVLMLSWEYPPDIVGGLGRHVHALATTLAAAGREVTVVTRGAPGAPREEITEGVHVVRAPDDAPSFPLDQGNMAAWAVAFNHSLTRAALRASRTRTYDVVHAHDWLVAHSAMTLREHLGVPLVATVHATEIGRHQGWLPEEHNRTIHSVETWLGYEANRVIVCSDYMKREVTRQLDVPADRTDVVHNGVDVMRWHARLRAVAAARRRYAGSAEPTGSAGLAGSTGSTVVADSVGDTDVPLLSFAGRLVYEKGVQHVIAALPRLRLRHPGLRLVIAGDGPYRPALQEEVRLLGLQEAVTFTGFLGGHDLTALMAASDCYVVPSIYEPFGMVALEAAAVGTPVAVADTGGLAEIVEHGVTGVKFPPGEPQALADAVSSLLLDREYARTLARHGRRRVREEYNWAAIAARTAAVYDAARQPMAPSAPSAAAAATAGPRTQPLSHDPASPHERAVPHEREPQHDPAPEAGGDLVHAGR